MNKQEATALAEEIASLYQVKTLVSSCSGDVYSVGIFAHFDHHIFGFQDNCIMAFENRSHWEAAKNIFRIINQDDDNIAHTEYALNKR